MVNLPTKFEVSAVSRYWVMKWVEMHKMGWFGVVRGYPRSSAMSAFDRAHMISYSFYFLESMHLSCAVFEIQRVIFQNSPTSTYLTCIWRPRWGWPRLNFEKIFDIVWRCLRDCIRPMRSHFDTITACDRQTQTDRHRTTATIVVVFWHLVFHKVVHAPCLKKTSPFLLLW